MRILPQTLSLPRIFALWGSLLTVPGPSAPPVTQPVSVPTPLTASFHGVPTEHDGTWQHGSLRVDAGLSARKELDSGSEEYGATLNLGLQF